MTTTATTDITFTYFLVLACYHEIPQVEYVGTDIYEIWGPGDGRWCRYCEINTTVMHIRDPGFTSRMWWIATAA